MSDKRPEDVFYDGLVAGTPVSPVVPKDTKKVVASTTPKPISPRSVFSHPDTHPVVLDLALLKHFQLEWFSWLPDTLFIEIERTFTTSIAEVNKLKILSAQTLHVIDAYWEEWEIFEKTIQALNGVPPRLDSMQPPDLSYLFSGVDIANSIRKENYSEEVSRYCAAVFLHENVHYAPEPLSFCQPFITQTVYHCKDCGKIGPVVPPFEGLCTSCAGYFTKDKAFDFKPDPNALKTGAGQNITIEATFDSDLVKARFEELDRMPPERLPSEIHQVSVDIQAAKLITAVDFKNYRSKQLKDQLDALRGWLETT